MQSLESIPTWLADFLGINLNAGQVILSIVVVLAILLPTLILSGKQRLPPTIMMFFALALLVGIGWAPFWLLIMVIAMTALAVAVFGRELIGG